MKHNMPYGTFDIAIKARDIAPEDEATSRRLVVVVLTFPFIFMVAAGFVSLCQTVTVQAEEVSGTSLAA